MPCKIPHDDGESMPRFLCRECNPDKFKSGPIVATVTAEPVADSTSKFAVKIKKRKLRKLRAEEKRLRDLADDLGKRDPSSLKRIYDALKVVEPQVAAAEREVEQARIATGEVKTAELQPWE